jgi:RNA polymerase sigma factor (sigma-70 family)
MPALNFNEESEQSLVEALQQGRHEKMNLLYDAYAPVMMGVITRIVADKDVAEEVLHETFVAIWTRIKVYNYSKNRFLLWVLAIARGIAIEALKKEKYKQSLNYSLPDKKEINDMMKEGSTLFASLTTQEKAIMDLIYLRGKSCTEAAAELGIAEEILKTSLKKAFIQIKAERSA